MIVGRRSGIVWERGYGALDWTSQTPVDAERTMYERARINLVSEIAPALKVSTEAAEQYLDDALAKGVLRPPKETPEAKKGA